MSSAYERFRWQETRPGFWSREIDEVEMAYTSVQRQWAGSGRSFFHMTGHVSLRLEVPKEASFQDMAHRLDAAIPKAWVALRAQHPTIASHVELDPERKAYIKVYPVNSAGWLEQSLKWIDNGQNGVDWANGDPPAPMLPTLNVIKPPSQDQQCVSRDIVLRAPHDVIDGIGTLLLFNNYIRLVSQAFQEGDSFETPSLDDPQVLQNLSPPFRVAAAIPEAPSPQILQRLQDILAEKDAPNKADIVDLPYKKGALRPGVHKRVEAILSVEDTSRLTAATKAIGATVTHVFHAAIALVLRDLQPKSNTPRPVQYVGYLLRNERPRCSAPYNDARHPATVYHSVSGAKLVVDMTVKEDEMASATKPTLSDEDKAEFLRIVEQLKKFYLTVRDDAEHHLLAPMLWAAGTSPLPTDPKEAHVVPPVPPPAEVASATISSMGQIDGMISHHHGPIEVHNPWVTGEELRSSLGLFLGTFRGQLSLSAAYNDAWHGREEVAGFVERCLRLVNVGLGL